MPVEPMLNSRGYILLLLLLRTPSMPSEVSVMRKASRIQLNVIMRGKLGVKKYHHREKMLCLRNCPLSEARHLFGDTVVLKGVSVTGISLLMVNQWTTQDTSMSHKMMISSP
ncbi:hypothetical protein MLD38_029772 [Melastoma candidum]|uniref:Uncharacterized protein n=1 Tax=Melastoma candidum TaxID=119954 RepID=A0ACB9N5K9_9MYRT|nr:hypothetical protein MLD38_029772 [Melastoma candidum]